MSTLHCDCDMKKKSNFKIKMKKKNYEWWIQCLMSFKEKVNTCLQQRPDDGFNVILGTFWSTFTALCHSGRNGRFLSRQESFCIEPLSVRYVFGTQRNYGRSEIFTDFHLNKPLTPHIPLQVI